MEEISINIIARMHSDFATKFGIPRQSGLVEELRSTIVFEPEYRNNDALRGLKIFLICGSSGSFLKRCGKAGRQPFVLHAWVEIPEWVYLQPAPLFVPITWGCPVSDCWMWSTPRNTARYSMLAERI